MLEMYYGNSSLQFVFCGNGGLHGELTGITVKYRMGRKLVGDRTAKARLEEVVITESKFADDAACIICSDQKSSGENSWKLCGNSNVCGNNFVTYRSIHRKQWQFYFKECNVETLKMLEEIMSKGDPVVTAILLTSIVDSNCIWITT